MIKLDILKKQILKEIKDCKNQKEIEEFGKKYLGKKGEISNLFKELSNFSLNERRKLGKKLNLLKKEIEILLERKREELKKEEETREKDLEFFDVTLSGKKIKKGFLHPLTKVLWKCQEIFERMGFSTVEGSEIENEYYNFDALNVPKEHPARDMWNTFWLKSQSQISKIKNQKLLLRTHTSSVQIRYMEKHQPPLRIIVPGRVFRYEATDPSHEIQFYQLEGLMIDKNISVANFKNIIQIFFNEFFKQEIKVRLRPSYFPFTEPSFEVDLKRGKGDWVEIAGAGMVHPYVLKAGKINPSEWQGFAFGFGIDRLAMMKYKINDVRLFYSGNLRFLKQF